jgi:hypothetical protein
VRQYMILTAFLSMTSPCEAAIRDTLDMVTLVQATRAEHPEGSQLPRTSDMLEALLTTPTSPYSSLTATPAFVRSAAWQALLAGLPNGLDGDAALAILQHDLGATKARPGVDVAAGKGFRDAFVAASATKAGIDPDIFWQALDLTGYGHSTRAATYGVAVQILRDKMAGMSVSQQRLTGVDSQVMDRFMRARQLDALSRADLDYLSLLVQYGVVHWRMDVSPHTGRRELPVPLRIARLAAAYRDSEGYVGGFPCQRDASPRLPHAGTGQPGDERPLCFVAATDHAVLRWYRDEVRRQAAWMPPKAKHDPSGLLTLFGLLVPLFDLAAMVESTEAAIAEDLAASGSITRTEAAALSDEADLLTCRIPL